MNLIEPKIFSVSKVNRYIKGVLESDYVLSGIWVKGEISNLKIHSSGHLYFSMKDENGVLNCIMFKGSAMRLPFLPENGMDIIVCGYVSIYERAGQYQLIVELMQPVGLGTLAVAFEQTKKRLLEEGLFDEDYKREICKFPQKIAVITSPTGAAVRDIIKVSKRRNKNIKITIIPVLVQGEYAAGDIVRAIRLANRHGGFDTIILGRGGGSTEDLWPFNEEIVARAIFASEIPIISAVGHETDFTIADFVADLRASTPSVAAELAVNDVSELERQSRELIERMNLTVNRILTLKNQELSRAKNSNFLLRPLDQIMNKQVYIEDLCTCFTNAIAISNKEKRIKLSGIAARLYSLSPLSVLGRGYSITSGRNGKVITRTDEVDIDETVDIRLQNGFLKAIVKDKVIV